MYKLIDELDETFSVHGHQTSTDYYFILQDSFEDPLVKESIDVIKETESESQTFVTEFKPKSPGTYAFCLDNRNSRFLSKTVQVIGYLDFQFDYKLILKAITLKQFDVLSTADVVDPVQLPVVDEQHAGDVDIARLKEYLHSLNSISKGITKIQKQQLRDRRRLSLHSDTNNATYNEVFAGSIVETFIFICVSVFQV